MHNVDGRMIAHVAIAVLVAMSIIGTIPVSSEPATDLDGYVFVPLAPISFKEEFQRYSTIPLKFQLLDPSGGFVKDAYAWVYVNGQPAMNPRNSNYYNQFRMTGTVYTFNFDTKPYSSGLGTIDLELSIQVMIGFDDPIFLWESFDISLR
jgi:hypothetical protein